MICSTNIRKHLPMLRLVVIPAVARLVSSLLKVGIQLLDLGMFLPFSVHFTAITNRPLKFSKFPSAAGCSAEYMTLIYDNTILIDWHERTVERNAGCYCTAQRSYLK